MPKRVTVNPYGKVVMDTRILDKLEKELKKKYSVRVGVLGGKATRPKGGPVTNADLGLIHEFGSISRKIPPRSWLRMPLEFKMPDVYKAIGQGLLDALTKGNIVRTFKRIGIEAVKVIDQAFETAGFNNWPANRPATVKRKLRKISKKKLAKMVKEGKRLDTPLIDTGEFRKSVTSEVIAK